MENRVKNKLIQEKFSALKKRSDLDDLWQKEKKKWWQLISINSVIGRKFKWDLPKIEQWCFDQGFDGMEIRLQDLSGFFPGVNIKALTHFKPQGVITVHLSDWNRWIDVYRNNQENLQKSFYTKENIIKYFGSDKPNILLQRLSQELEIAREWGAKAATWHANQIDYEEILFSERGLTDKEVIDSVKSFTKELMKLNDSFNSTLSLENGSAIDRGVRRFNDFQEIFSSPTLRNVGITLDTAHLMTVLLQVKGKKLDRAEDELLEELRLFPNLLKKIRVVHLSDTLFNPSLKKKVNGPDLKKARKDFWYKRKLIRNTVIDDHLPLGFTLKSAKQILNFIGSANDNKILVVSELQISSFSMLKKAIKLQKEKICF